MTLSKRLAALAALALGSVALQGQGPEAQPLNMPTNFVLHTIKEGKLYWVETNVPDMGIIIGDTGVILIDTGSSGKDLADVVAKVTNKPITTVIETHDDTDHINGLYTLPGSDKFKIIAHEQNWQNQWRNSRMLAIGAKCPANPMPPMPNVFIKKDKVDTHIDGVHIVLHHFGPSHTNGDLIIELPDYKVAFIGDIAMDKDMSKTGQDHNMFWKHEKGGTPTGFFHNVDELMKLPVTGFVSGHSSHLMSKDDVRHVRDGVKSDYEKVAQMTRDGKTLDEVQIAMGEDKFKPRGGCVQYMTLPWFAWNETKRNMEELK